MKDKRIAELFERHKVLSKKELDSRYGVYTETYETIVRYEGALAADMVKTLIVPAALEYTANLAETIKSIESINKTKATAVRNILKDVASNMEKAADETTKLETALKGASTDKIRKIMADLREAVDALEGLVPAEIWPLPSYAEMLFIS
ncbi:MAG: glutamine synthetase type III, partial [Candidatus Omnitrophica bacterium]|nr:glutamine synthetase type III [Candidatus Omnitrophota bacterium]